MTDKQKERDNLINTLNGALKDVFEYVPLDSVIRLADILIEKGGIASSEKEQMMTDNDIIKALELQPYCNPKKGQCGKCPYLIGCNDCATRFPQDALDLINRQKAEIERLQKAKYIYSTVDYCAEDLDKALKEIEVYKNNLEAMAKTMHNSAKFTRAEAITEFAERLKEYLDDFFNSGEDALLDTVDMIDQIAKETKEKIN